MVGYENGRWQFAVVRFQNATRIPRSGGGRSEMKRNECGKKKHAAWKFKKNIIQRMNEQAREGRPIQEYIGQASSIFLERPLVREL